MARILCIGARCTTFVRRAMRKEVAIEGLRAGSLLAGFDHLPAGFDHLPAGFDHLDDSRNTFPAGFDHLPAGFGSFPGRV